MLAEREMRATPSDARATSNVESVDLPRPTTHGSCTHDELTRGFVISLTLCLLISNRLFYDQSSRKYHQKMSIKFGLNCTRCVVRKQN